MNVTTAGELSAKHPLDRPLSKHNLKFLGQLKTTVPKWRTIRAIYYNGCDMYAVLVNDQIVGNWFDRYDGSAWRVYRPSHDLNRRPTIAEMVLVLTGAVPDHDRVYAAHVEQQLTAPGTTYFPFLYEEDGSVSTAPYDEERFHLTREGVPK